MSTEIAGGDAPPLIVVGVSHRNSPLQVREALAECRTQWLEAQQRRKAVELLLEKKADKVRQKAQRQEQKMLDDYAILRRYHQSGL